MLSKKYKEGLGEPALGEAFEKAKKGKVLAAGGQWYWISEDEKKEKVKSSDFEFLTLDEEGDPWETMVSYEEGEWNAESKNVSSELGGMGELIDDLEEMEEKIIDDKRVLDLLDEVDKLKKAKKKAPHLRLSRLQFSVFDMDLEKPVWRAEFKNWPLVSYLKKSEKPKTVEVVIDAVNGKVLSYDEE